MADKAQLTPEAHRQQIETYIAVRPCYLTYADALKRVLEKACQVSFPAAFVQARAKAVSSFARPRAGGTACPTLGYATLFAKSCTKARHAGLTGLEPGADAPPVAIPE